MAFHGRIPGKHGRMNSRAIDAPCFFPEYVLRTPSGLRVTVMGYGHWPVPIYESYRDTVTPGA